MERTTSEPHYKKRVLRLYDAAASLDFDFKLFVSADGRAQDELKDIVATTRGLKAQFHVDGKPVIFVYGGPTSSCATTANWADA